jgi:hypothetical protein
LQQEQYFSKDESEPQMMRPDEREDAKQGKRENHFQQGANDLARLPTISLVRVPHPRIAHLYQRCFEYVEPWQWSPVTELVETGVWFFEPLQTPLALKAGVEAKQLPRPANPTNARDGA